MADPTNKTLSLITRTVTGILVLALSVAIAYYLSQTRPQVEQMPLDQSLPQVQVINAAPVPVHLQWSGYGSASAMDLSDVPSRVTSIVSQIPDKLDAGVAVQAGDLIVQLDPSDFLQQKQIALQSIDQIKANLAKLDTDENYLGQQKLIDQADIELAKREWERTKDLFNRKAGTQQDVDRAQQTYLMKQRSSLNTAQQFDQIANRRNELQAQLQSQEATLASAELNLKRCTITSPINGVLQSVDVEQGEMVTAGKRVARVVNMARMQVALQLPAPARRVIGVGDRVTLMPVGSEQTKWQSRIARIAPEDDPTTRTLTVYVQLDQSAGNQPQLAPGRYLQGIVFAHAMEKHWLAPSRSVQSDQIMIVRDGRVMTLPANITHLLREKFDGMGLPDDNWAVLGTTLQSGDAIILTPSRLVSDGKQVQAIVIGDQTELAQGGKP
jgi:RND family efflux transporter MFP subunit